MYDTFSDRVYLKLKKIKLVSTQKKNGNQNKASRTIQIPEDDGQQFKLRGVKYTVGVGQEEKTVTIAGTSTKLDMTMKKMMFDTIEVAARSNVWYDLDVDSFARVQFQNKFAKTFTLKDKEGDFGKVAPLTEVYPMREDLDIDSDNNNKITSKPDRNEEEDKIEQDEEKPGKLIGVNDNDDDGDGIPDFADGFQEATDGERFVKMVVDLPKLPPHVQNTSAKLWVRYNDQDPDRVKKNDEGMYVLGDDRGNLRLWTVNGNRKRSVKPVDQGGDFIPSTNQNNRGPYDPADLGFDRDTRTKTFFVEAVNESKELGEEKIEFRYDPNSTYKSPAKVRDVIRATAGKVDLDIDSDNTNGFMELTEKDGRTTKEDRIENDDNKPGKLVCVNDTDVDGDQVIDYADGFDRLQDYKFGRRSNPVYTSE